MPSITAVLHTHNDVLRLGRALETLYPCDEILVIHHGPRDGTADLARQYGARVVPAEPDASPDHYLCTVGPGWALCLDPCESITETLAASLFEWKSIPNAALTALAFSVRLREETVHGWVDLPTAQTRLIPHTWKGWDKDLPLHDPSALPLEGTLLRFAFP